MSALILGLLTAVVTANAGGTADLTVLAYSPVEKTVTINGAPYRLAAGVTSSLIVPVPVQGGVHEHPLVVADGHTTYTLQATVVGRHDWRSFWWLGLVPVAGLLAAVRLRRTAAGSS